MTAEELPLGEPVDVDGLLALDALDQIMAQRAKQEAAAKAQARREEQERRVRAEWRRNEEEYFRQLDEDERSGPYPTPPPQQPRPRR